MIYSSACLSCMICFCRGEGGFLSCQSGDGRYLLELYLSGLLEDGVLRSYLSCDFSLEYLSSLYGEGVRRSYLSRDFSLESSLLDLSLWGDFLSLQCLLVCGDGNRWPLLLLGASLFDDLFALDEDRCLQLWLLSSCLSSFRWCLWCLWYCDVDGESCLRLVLVSSGVSSLHLCLCLLWVLGGGGGGGGGLFVFMVGGWVVSGFTGLCVPWCSFWFDADFYYWGGLRWWFAIFRCCGLVCWDGDISQSCFMDAIQVTVDCLTPHEVTYLHVGLMICHEKRVLV